MNTTTTAIVNVALAVVKQPTALTKALAKAHTIAAEFHTHLAESFEAGDELAGPLDRETRIYWQKAYAEALGKAAAALQKMPIKWQAILSCELEVATAISTKFQTA